MSTTPSDEKMPRPPLRPRKSKGFMSAVLSKFRRDKPRSSGYYGKHAEMTTTSLVGKVAIVTGSSRSIGASIARSLGEQGASVVVNYKNNEDAAHEVVHLIKSQHKGTAIAVQADASTPAGCQRLIDAAIGTFGKLDILVLNSGFMGSRAIDDIDEEFFETHMNVNVKAPLFMAKAAMHHFSSPGGRIIFISSSLTAANNILPSSLCYVASKGAIEQIARVLAKEGGNRGFTVNTVSPGPVDTPQYRAGKSHIMMDLKNVSTHLAMPEDVAPIVTFLSSPAARWINGQNIRINGGIVL